MYIRSSTVHSPLLIGEVLIVQILRNIACDLAFLISLDMHEYM